MWKILPQSNVVFNVKQSRDLFGGSIFAEYLVSQAKFCIFYSA